MLRFNTLVLATLASVALLLPPAALAQDDRVSVTFRLTIEGQAPPGETFVVGLEIGVPAEGSSPLPVWICGVGAEVSCEGGGKVYEHTRMFRRGKELLYSFGRAPGNGSGGLDYSRAQTLEEGILVLEEDTTISATYSYPDGGGAEPGMPRTGAGGAGTAPPLPALVAMLSALVVVGRAAFRRR